MARSTRRTTTASKTSTKTASKPSRSRKTGAANWTAVIGSDKRFALAIAAIGFCVGIVTAIAITRLPMPFVGPFSHVSGEVCNLALEVDRADEALTLADSIAVFRRRIERGEFDDLAVLLPALRTANRGMLPSDAVARWEAFSVEVGRILERCHETKDLLTPQDAAVALQAVEDGLREAAEKG